MRLAIVLTCFALFATSASAELLDPATMSLGPEAVSSGAASPGPVMSVPVEPRPISPASRAPQTLTPAPALATPDPVRRADLMATLEAAGTFNTFVRLVEASGLEPTLSGKAAYTVFAPTDDAFKQMSRTDLEALLSPPHRAELQQLIGYHIVPGEVTLANMSGRQEVASLGGDPLVIYATMDEVRINSSRIVGGDLIATNGVVHAIDQMLAPPLAAEDRPTN